MTAVGIIDRPAIDQLSCVIARITAVFHVLVQHPSFSRSRGSHIVAPNTSLQLSPIHLRWTMPDDDKKPNAAVPLSTAQNAPVLPKRSIWSLPPPVKRIFDKFPLTTYEANEVPARAPRNRSKHVLHVFTTEEHARSGRPSFNPGCLKWQVSQVDRKAVCRGSVQRQC